MATKKTTTETVAAETAEATAAASATKAEKKFSIDALAKYSRKLFGVSSAAFAGATSGLTGEYTIEEMKTIIKEWGEKEVK